MTRPLEEEELQDYSADQAEAHLTDANEAAFRAKWEDRLGEAGLDLHGDPLTKTKPLTNGGGPASLPPADANDEVGSAVEPDEGDEASLKADLVAIASEGELFSTPDGVPFASFRAHDHRETWPIRSGGFREWLSAQYFYLTGKSPSGQKMTDALSTIAGIAKWQGESRQTYLRIAPHEGAIYIDLADAEWRAIEVSETGWRIVSEPPVRFWRSASMRPLPVPVTGGDLSELRSFINVSDDDAWHLLVGWLVMAFSTSGPYPVAVLHGEQGSAKSTAERMLRSLIDPSQSPLRATPKDNQDLLIACKNGWVIAYDNLSHVEDWLSDALCRVATGAGMSKRQLYTDSDEVVLDACRPIILNGISSLATRGDLLDRSLLIDLEPIPPESRRTERDLWAEFDRARPAILGTLLEAVSSALRNRDEVRTTALARMADFEVWVTAAEEGLGWAPGTFGSAYEANRHSAHYIALDASIIGAPLRSLLDNGGGSWSGTAANLLERLGDFADDRITRSRYWPRNAWAMSNALNRLAPNLRAVGFVVERTRAPGGNRDRIITLRLVRDDRDAGDEPLPEHQPQDTDITW